MTNPYNTPPASPNDNRNMLIAVLLTGLVIFAWKVLYADPQQAQMQAARQAEQQFAQAKAQQEAASVMAIKNTAAGVPAVQAIPQNREQALADVPRISIRTPELHGSISLKGLRFDDVTLANYHQTIDPDSPDVTLLNPRYQGNGYFAEFGWAGNGVTLPNADTLWEANVSELNQNQPVIFRWVNPEGVVFEKEIAVDKKYMFTIKRRVINNGAASLQLAPYSLINRTLNEEGKHYYILHEGPLGADEEKLHEYEYKELREANAAHEQQQGWAGITDKYWLTAIIPDKQDGAFKANYQYYRSDEDNRYQVDILGAQETIAAGSTSEYVVRFFAGAKEVDVLDAYAERYAIPMFDRAIDFGTLYFLTRPIFEALQGLHALLGSFGLAILALTVCIKLIMFPLANKSYASMSQMKLLMPKMKEIKERYQDDRVKMNQEIMAMYKEEGVNPASGCLPLLIQIPVFFALYKVLFITIEMRHTPFYGWIEDMSVKDPTNLFTLFGMIPWDAPTWLHVGAWPLIMTLTMIIQQRISPKPSDPAQAQVMQLLPYIFLFVFATFPAGLVIYWAWNNTLSIIQQYLITKRYEKLYDKETGRRIRRKAVAK